MALARALSSLRASVLSRVSIPVHGSSLQTAGTRPSLQFLRGFAEGTYLDKTEVEERVVNAIKNFDKVDPSKVRGSLSAGSIKPGQQAYANSLGAFPQPRHGCFLDYNPTA